MIRFFRKIRQRLLNENRPAGKAGKFSKYLIYAIGEIILVVIGILIALQINTWNDKRIQNERVKSYAQKLIIDLAQDIQNVKFINHQAETAYLRLDSLTNYARYLSLDDCKNLDIFLFVHNARYKPYSWNRASFEEVKSSGILNYFDNDSLVNLMVKYEASTRHMDLDYEEDRDLIQEATKLMSKVINYNYKSNRRTYDITSHFSLDTVKIIDYKNKDFYLELKKQPVDFIDRDRKKFEEAVNAYIDLKFNFEIRCSVELPRLIADAITIIQLLENHYLIEEINNGAVKRYPTKELSELFREGMGIDQIIEMIKSDDHNLNTYDISEYGINKFGYMLLFQNKKIEASKIFKLNTELYPLSFNTYDSYGECLLEIGDIKNATKAYEKLLELNPDNINAKRALEKFKK